MDDRDDLIAQKYAAVCAVLDEQARIEREASPPPRKRGRDPKTGQLKPRRCGLYVPGHVVHYIQAIHSAGEPHLGGHLIAVEDNIIIINVDYGNKVRRLRYHDVEGLVERVGIGGRVGFCKEYSILRHPGRGQSGACFSVADAEAPWIPCDNTPLTSTTPEALAERLRTHGGFTVPGRSVIDSLEA